MDCRTYFTKLCCIRIVNCESIMLLFVLHIWILYTVYVRKCTQPWRLMFHQMCGEIWIEPLRCCQHAVFGRSSQWSKRAVPCHVTAGRETGLPVPKYFLLLILSGGQRWEVSIAENGPDSRKVPWCTCSHLGIPWVRVQPWSVLMLQAAAEEAALRVELAQVWPPVVASRQVVAGFVWRAKQSSRKYMQIRILQITTGWFGWLIRRKG